MGVIYDDRSCTDGFLYLANVVKIYRFPAKSDVRSIPEYVRALTIPRKDGDLMMRPESGRMSGVECPFEAVLRFLLHHGEKGEPGELLGTYTAALPSGPDRSGNFRLSREEPNICHADLIHLPLLFCFCWRTCPWPRPGYLPGLPSPHYSMLIPLPLFNMRDTPISMSHFLISLPASSRLSSSLRLQRPGLTRSQQHLRQHM